MRLTFRCRMGDRAQPASVTVYCDNGARSNKGEGEIVVDIDGTLGTKAVVVAPGFWRMIVEDVKQVNEVDCQPIVSGGPIGWWHTVHGIHEADDQRGAGLRIGVIDESLPPEPSLFHVRNLGRMHLSRLEVDNVSRLEVNNDLQTWHGASVCGLLAARPEGTDGFEGIVPGAEVLFLSARSQRDPLRLNPQSIAAAILHLSKQEKCDIISVSAGEGLNPKENIRKAVQDAFDVGCLCIFAAGNKPGLPLYPAVYQEVIAVSAFGKLGVGPDGSLIQFYEENECACACEDLYVWQRAPSGEGIDCIAAGVGVISNKDGQPHLDLCGTSFSCPVAVGVLAAALARDTVYSKLQGAERAEWGRRKLVEMCDRNVFPAKLGGRGIPILPQTQEMR